MKKLALLSTVVALTLSIGCLAASGPPSKQKSCTITCFEKTPTCYVTQTGKDCLEITNVKPNNKKKGSFSCELKGCETTTTYGDTGVDVDKKESN